MAREGEEQRITGNTFFAFFVNPGNGRSRVRLVPVDEVDDIVLNPDDSKEPRYYIRILKTDAAEERVAYPDIDYDPINKPASIPDPSGGSASIRVNWDLQILHVKTGGLSEMRFGLPELYSALNWGRAYKKILENFATILDAYARLAMKVSGAAGKKGIAATKSKMNTGIGGGRAGDSNPPNTAGGWFVSSGGMDVTPIKTSNSTTGPDEARALRSMVAAGSDTPEHFFGDSDIGNFATSSTLDRPTELKMVSRQKMWAGVILHICMKLKEWSARAPNGKLRKAGYKAVIGVDPFDGTRTVFITPPDGQTDHVVVEFASILERDVTDRVRAVVQAATLGGSPAEGIIPDRKLLFKLLMVALGEKDAEFLVDKYYPESVLQGFADPADRVEDEHLAAQGKKDLGDAALQQAAAAKINAQKPAPKPSGAPLSPASASK